ncbi:hypothetical protein TSTA_069270 [Talaromyces stipitatus ATCC 10500]|uniref:Uncharacterized protein n=1 Tax=Talaromyces stipitatus (strain ATCC 10500 / CBS 375.48 / QM 6759 / NRRL 1006) TaxID=441959 RepID=B8LYZ8_TALSN|nr:uncharacterized protein TSTA_069270 [Talaromyces stipitatus ATCC 10500]EED23506.1 hypothetical protein TSTA_069270 [Talaromyces stipitatus ATCC 10500]
MEEARHGEGELRRGAQPGVTDQRRLSGEAEERAAAETAEQERIRREQDERVVAEQERLRREAQEKAAAEAAQRQEAIVAEQPRLQREAEEQAAEQERDRRETEERAQKEAEEKAAAKEAEAARLRREAEQAAEPFRLEREAEERAAEEERLEQGKERLAVAAEQERLRREAEESADVEMVEQERLRQETSSAEEERIAQERANALAHLEQGDEDVSAPPDAGPFERSSSTTQVDLPIDLPNLITQLREGSDSPGQDHSPIVEPHGLATQSFPETAIESHTVEAPTGDVSPPRMVTAALEPITEEAEVSSLIPSVIIEGDRQRQLRERIAERRRADKEKVANSERASLEIDDNFAQTRGAESEDLYTNEPDEEVIIPPELLTESTLPPEGASEILRQDRIQEADTAASAPTTEPLPQVTVTRTKSKSKPKPKGIQKVRKSAQATRKPAASRASFDPSSRPLTQMEFYKIMADLPAWPGNDQSAHDDVPPPPGDLEADTIIFRVWRGGKWIEIQRVAIDPDDPFHIERVANRYEQVECVYGNPQVLSINTGILAIPVPWGFLLYLHVIILLLPFWGSVIIFE